MSPRPDTPRLARTVILLGLTSFFTDLGSDMIFPLLPVFVADTLGGGAAFLGIIEGAADTVSSLLKLVSGRMADRLPRRKPLVVVGYLLASLVRPLVAIATAPWHVLAVRLVDRTGKGIRSSPRDALIADSTDPKLIGRAFGFHRAMDHAGAVAGPLLAAGLIALHVTVRQVFVIAAVPGVLAIVALTSVREPGRDVVAPPPREATPPLPRRLKRYLAVVLLFSLGNSSDAFLLLRARNLGVPLAAVPLLWALLHVSKMVWSHIGGIWADKVSRVRLILAGWCVYAATYLSFACAVRPWQVWLVFVVYGVYYGLSEPAEKALVRDLAPANARGSAFGAFNFIVGVAALPAGALMGALWAWQGQRVALVTGVAFALVASLLLAVWGIASTKKSHEI